MLGACQFQPGVIKGRCLQAGTELMLSAQEFKEVASAFAEAWNHNSPDVWIWEENLESRFKAMVRTWLQI